MCFYACAWGTFPASVKLPCGAGGYGHEDLGGNERSVDIYTQEGAGADTV